MELYLLKNLLDKSIEEKRIYCFHEYGDSSFFCGYVLSYNKDTVQIQHYTKYGEQDGSVNLPYSNIRLISIKGEYIDRIQYLIEHNKELSTSGDASKYFKLNSASEGILPILHECLNDRSLILHFESNGEFYTGFVEDIISSTHFVFTEIENSGNIYETAVHKIEDISAIRINDKVARKNLLLYNWKKSKGQ
ncbi:hypothetical protein [Dysgonomonas sp. 25]|uniref:hypothetical protein n=1 Tax=Dysgonomonas sp. 25 TaxID=2302933 RepID=UPI0013D80DEE|nr:hypothetical protein [Dysgonomonas sp. 25]NDV68459.1 hypothetical protein [Dysgonomonas sp. 25]